MKSATPEFEELLIENRAILERLSNKILNPERNREFEFRVTVQSKADGKEFRRKYREKFAMPTEGLFILVDDPRTYEVVMCVDMPLCVDLITQTEFQLGDIAAQFENTSVYWEFKD